MRQGHGCSATMKPAVLESQSCSQAPTTQPSSHNDYKKSQAIYRIQMPIRKNTMETQNAHCMGLHRKRQFSPGLRVEWRRFIAGAWGKLLHPTESLRNESQSSNPLRKKKAEGPKEQTGSPGGCHSRRDSLVIGTGFFRNPDLKGHARETR